MKEPQDLDAYRKWIGRTEETRVRVDGESLRRFRATFDLRDDGETGRPAPPGIHWCLAPSAVPTSSLAPDGHPSRGGVLPPISLPRRMWAGGRLEFGRPLNGGEELVRTSRIEEVAHKNGRTGPLSFVTVSHTFQTIDEVVVKERQDIIYRGLPSAAAAGLSTKLAHDEREAAEDWPWTRSVDPHPTLLFRYSALTFNGHRIHYDRPYCTEEEGYPGLVVHGPLQATLLLQFAAEIKGGKSPRVFEYRSEAPLFDGARFKLAARQSEPGLVMCTLDGRGKPAMRAVVTW